ncbi:MAG TPA: M23 family metallopeptidase [Burkholderiaceae bacterium]|nr:M23 family metallopeptidase [Burkholderiaceae bacterium]
MQIILVHSKLRSAHTLAVGPWHVLALMLAFSMAIIATAYLLQQLMPRSTMNAQSIAPEVGAYSREQSLRNQLSAMAGKLGEMQAQLARLDVLGERVSTMVGLKPQEFGFGQAPGRGGVTPSATREIAFDELQREVDRAVQDVEHRSAAMTRFESALLDRSIDGKLLPSNTPVRQGFIGSGFGWRIDPFNGRRAMHEGLDFAAPAGSPIHAAAGGVVVAAQTHPDYGQMIDVDHGNGLVTRYAHASKLHVRAGDIVKRGDKIAEVGSTGRSTGAHLHFEVHVNGTPKNPLTYLSAGGSLQPRLASAR